MNTPTPTPSKKNPLLAMVLTAALAGVGIMAPAAAFADVVSEAAETAAQLQRAAYDARRAMMHRQHDKELAREALIAAQAAYENNQLSDQDMNAAGNANRAAIRAYSAAVTAYEAADAAAREGRRVADAAAHRERLRVAREARRLAEAERAAAEARAAADRAIAANAERAAEARRHARAEAARRSTEARRAAHARAEAARHATEARRAAHARAQAARHATEARRATAEAARRDAAARRAARAERSRRAARVAWERARRARATAPRPAATSTSGGVIVRPTGSSSKTGEAAVECPYTSSPTPLSASVRISVR